MQYDAYWYPIRIMFTNEDVQADLVSCSTVIERSLDDDDRKSSSIQIPHEFSQNLESALPLLHLLKTLHEVPIHESVNVRLSN
jgi:hypothetical protein